MNRLAAEPLVKGVAIAASAISHLGWWLDWQTRARVGQGCRALDEVG